MRPYIIATPDYRNQSHGIRAVHKLCHVLRLKGLEAYVTSKVLNNKGWKTPTIFEKPKLKKELILRGAICVYPEEQPNWLYSKNPVSWRLLPLNSSPIEKVFVYHQSFDATKPVLYIEDFEHELFNTKGVGKRENIALYLGKGWMWENNIRAIRKMQLDYPKAIMITRDFPKTWPTSRKELAKILKGIELFYTADPSSQITAEVRFCGCPVVYVGDPMPQWAKDINDPEGFAYINTPEEVERAKATVGDFQQKYLKREREQDGVVDNFIKLSQEYAETKWMV